MVGDPLRKKQVPSTVVDAKFSIPFTLATAIIRGRVTIEDFSERSIADPSILEISQKVTVVLDEEIEKQFSRVVGPTVVNFKLKNGSVISARSEFYKEYNDNSMVREEARSKFRNCLVNGFKPLEKSKIENILEILENLEYLENFNDLVELLNFNR